MHFLAESINLTVQVFYYYKFYFPQSWRQGEIQKINIKKSKINLTTIDNCHLAKCNQLPVN